MKSKNQAKNLFIGLNERGIPGTVGSLGEEIAASLVRGRRVSDHSEDTPFADVVNTDIGLAVQAKMCNGRHAHRPPPKQVKGLFNEIDSPFLFDKGVYVLAFYGGVHERSNGKKGSKSKIWSRKLSKTMRREIICRELQYIYILDVRLIHHILVNCPQFIREDTTVYNPEEKPDRKKALYLNRTFMAGFPQGSEWHRAILDATFGQSRWFVRTATQELLFVNGTNGPFSREIPVHVVGSRGTVNAIASLFKKPIAQVHLGNENAPKML